MTKEKLKNVLGKGRILVELEYALRLIFAVVEYCGRHALEGNQ